MVSNTRLYGAAIALTSGVYSLWSASTAPGTTTSGWVMTAVGLVVLLHGVVLLTEYADRLGTASGPLMIAYAGVMLLNQALLATGVVNGGRDAGMDGGMGMDPGMSGGMGESAMSAGMGWDAGMVALALLMLVSGLLMRRGGSMGTAADGM